MYLPGDCSRVPIGSRSDIVKTPAEHRPGPLQAKSGPHRLPPRSRRTVPCVFSFKMYTLVPGGSRAVYGFGIFFARVTFKLELKVSRSPRGVKKMTARGRDPSGSLQKAGREKPGDCLGRPFLRNVTKALLQALVHVRRAAVSLCTDA